VLCFGFFNGGNHFLYVNPIFDVFIEKELEDPKKEKIETIEVEEKTNISLDSVDQRMMTIDDFLGDLNI
jgi:hypothetical protein